MRPHRPTRHLAPVAALMVVLVALAPPVGAQDDDPTLDQVIESDQTVVDGRAVLSSGHVDIGPMFVDDQWKLMIHDDTVDPSVWRSPDDSVFQIGDAGLTEAPDDPTYGFLGADPGEPVHVVSQTQQPDVVWIGWNTQAPSVLDRIDRGMTLTMLGAQGPGEVSVYLQSGNFGEPEVLWQSSSPDRQSLWVDVNTHTHANWVFTEPGTYLIRVEASADLLTGEAVSDTVDLRIAVGDEVDPSDAADADFTASVADDDRSGAESSSAASDVAADATSSSTPALLAIAAIAALLAAAVAVVVLRSARTRRQARDLSEMRDASEPAAP